MMKCVVLFVVLSVGAAFAPASSLSSDTAARTRFELTPLPAWQDLKTAPTQDTSSFFASDDCCREGVEADGPEASAAFAIAPEPADGFILLAGLIVIAAFRAAGASGGFPGRKRRRQ